jgi:hypothetical protein
MQFARKRFRRHRLARPGRSDEQNVTIWNLAVFAEPIAFALLAKDVGKASEKAVVQHDVLQFESGLPHFQQPFEAAARMRKWDRNRRTARVFCPCLVYFGTHLLRRFPPSLSRFGRGDLKGDREERVFVALGAASEHCEYLFGVRHGDPFVPNLTTATRSDERVSDHQHNIRRVRRGRAGSTRFARRASADPRRGSGVAAIR